MQLWDLRNILFIKIGPHMAEYDEAALKLGDQPELLTGERWADVWPVNAGGGGFWPCLALVLCVLLGVWR